MVDPKLRSVQYVPIGWPIAAVKQCQLFTGRGASAHPDRSAPCPGELQLERDRQGRGHPPPRGLETSHLVTTQTATGL